MITAARGGQGFNLSRGPFPLFKTVSFELIFGICLAIGFGYWLLDFPDLNRLKEKWDGPNGI